MPEPLGGHSSWAAVADDLQHATRFIPRTTGGRHAGLKLLALARGGVCPAPLVTERAVRSYRTFSTLPATEVASAVCFLWHCPWPATLGPVGVTHHRVLSCSDFPRR